MKNIIRFSAILIVFVLFSCSKSDDSSTPEYGNNIISSWKFEGAFFRGTAGQIPLLISDHNGDALGCLFQSVLDIKSNKTAQYNHFLYSFDTNECISNSENYQNMKWELLNSQKLKLTYDYMNESYTHVFDFLVNEDVLTMDIEDVLETVWIKN